MRILKFGGSSVQTPERILKIIDIVKNSQRQNGEIAVVVSAFGGITDHLILTADKASKGDPEYLHSFGQIRSRHIQAVQKLVLDGGNGLSLTNEMLKELEDMLHGVYLVKEVSKRTMDFVMSFGERLSAYIISQAFLTFGMEATYLDSRKLLKTDENFGSARVNVEKSYQNIQEYFHKNKSLQIITGFIGSTENNETTTLGRGGSDYTASLFGAAIGSKEIEIWTDVDGVMTADPRKVKKALSISEMTYAEAMELSHFGAKVIHPPTMQPALSKRIPIRIKNTFNPDFPGTLITTQENIISKNTHLITGISSINEIAILLVEGSGLVGVVGMSMRLFGALSRAGINVIMISQASSEHSICFSVSQKEAENARKMIDEEFALEIQAAQIHPTIVEKDLSIVAVVGENMRHTPGISARLFQALGKNGVNVVAIAQGSSELNISAVIAQEDQKKALESLHQAFFLSDLKTIHLFLVGVGQIGSTLINQLNHQEAYLKKELKLELSVIGLANSKKMVFKTEGIDLSSWKEQLDQSEDSMNIETFMLKMKELNLSHTVFIDCTASNEITKKYPEILSSSISIVTPNKKALSGSTEEYKSLKQIATKHNVKLLYETNVGAGLPVLSTLKDLLDSGDKILKIEAVLSGTLSYIFNSFSARAKFSEIVVQAKSKGYTEPDPRDDLKGLDVARKLLILARESGLNLELQDITVQNLVPRELQEITSVDDFLSKLKEFDDYYNQFRQPGRILRYCATLENQQAKVGLEIFPLDHPFAALSGSDNIIAFTTERYKDRPLVVKGPGAGAEVTAAGVFADIIKVANYIS